MEEIASRYNCFLFTMKDQNRSGQIPFLKKILLVFAAFSLLGGGLLFLSVLDKPDAGSREPSAWEIASGWEKLARGRKGKVIFASPPRLLVLNLGNGEKKELPGIVVAGGKGRNARGKSPCPFWAPNGGKFLYRFAGHVYVGDEQGHKAIVADPRMDMGDEASWSWLTAFGKDWAVGPALNGDMIAVNPADPGASWIVYYGKNIKKHCEITGSGKFVVYDDGRSVYVARNGSSGPGMNISRGQSCRPCAAPDDRVAWLAQGHSGYRIHDAAGGRELASILAPPGEEIYRLNWSNDPDFAAHMYGSRGNERMHVRRVSNGGYLYIGNGWDPDLWLEPAR